MLDVALTLLKKPVAAESCELDALANVASAVNDAAALNALVPLKTLLVVVPNAVEIVSAPVEPVVCSGYVAASEVTPVLVITPVEPT